MTRRNTPESATEPQALSGFLTEPATPTGSARVFGALAVEDHPFTAVRYQSPADFVVRNVRGEKMRTLPGLYDEFAAAWQFPYYFGHNKDAFDECLCDFDELWGAAPGYVVAVRHASEVLCEDPGERAWFVDALTDCAARWARREVVFRVVLQGRIPGFWAQPLRVDAV